MTVLLEDNPSLSKVNWIDDLCLFKKRPTAASGFGPSSEQPKAEIMEMVLSPVKNIESSVLRMKYYLQQVIFNQNKSIFIRLPSLKALTSFYNASKEDVSSILDEFLGMGYDYEVINFNEPVLLWDTLKLSAFISEKKGV